MKTLEEIENYKNTLGDEVEVTVTYYAEVTATIRMPKLGVKQIIKELKKDYYGQNMEEKESIKLINMVDLIVDGYEIDKDFLFENLIK